MDPRSEPPKLHTVPHAFPSSPFDESCPRLRGQSCSSDANLSLPARPADSEARPVGRPQFSLGQLCITANAQRALPRFEVLHAISRHGAGDWGLLEAHDWQLNERALRRGGRLFSVYQASTGQRFYVVTEATRDVTTVLLPEDY